MRSPDCCGKQWPVSFDLKRDPRIKDGELGKIYSYKHDVLRKKWEQAVYVLIKTI